MRELRHHRPELTENVDGEQMSPRSRAGRHWGWLTRLAAGFGALVVVAGAAVLLALFLGRPQVSVSSSGQALVQVRLSGLGTELTEVRATSAGRTVALVHDAGGLVPAAQLAQGQVVRVTATAAPPSWLGWLLGPSVSATKTVRTPAAAPSGKVAVASDPGRVRVSFDHPVSVVEYRAAGGPSKLIHLRGAATVVDFAVPSNLAAGFLQVAAAPQRWETVAPRMSTVTWFVAPPGGDRSRSPSPPREAPPPPRTGRSPSPSPNQWPISSATRGRPCPHRWRATGTNRDPTRWSSHRTASASAQAPR